MQDLDQAGMEMLQVESCVLCSGPSHLQKNLESNSWRRVKLRARNYKQYTVAVMHNSAVETIPRNMRAKELCAWVLRITSCDSPNRQIKVLAKFSRYTVDYFSRFRVKSFERNLVRRGRD